MGLLMLAPKSLLIKIHATSDSVYRSSTSDFSCSIRSVLISEINSMSDFRNFQINENENSQPILELAHPWPEWVQLMKCLLDKGYFCREEGKMLCNAGMGMKDFNVIRTVCLNFGRDHFHLLRFGRDLEL
ncbi:hypothetical protein HKD37_10G028574 [Glycine soja]